MAKSRRAKITARTVLAMAPDEVVFDTVLLGFGIRRQKSQTRTFLLKCTIDGQQRWFTIGRFGAPWTVEQARAEAHRILGDLAHGKDPVLNRTRRKEVPRVDELIDLWLTEHGPDLARSTRESYELLLRVHLPKALKQRRADRVELEELKKLHRNITKAGSPYSANNFVRVLRSMFSWARTQNWWPTERGNPATGIKPNKERKRRCILTTDELGRLGSAILDELVQRCEPNRHGRPQGQYCGIYPVTAIILLALTGARRNEILTLRWDCVDLNEGLIELPTRKSDGIPYIYLCNEALELLATLPRVEGNPYVIPGKVQGRHLVNVRKAWATVCKRAGIRQDAAKKLRLHDLRHHFGSTGGQLNLPLAVFGKQMGHKRMTTTERYVTAGENPVRSAANEIGSSIGQGLDISARISRTANATGNERSRGSEHVSARTQ